MSARLTSVVLLAVVALSLACAVCHAQALTDLPPRVIDCNPKPFAVNVDVGLKQISVTFDRPMDTNSRIEPASGRWRTTFREPGTRRGRS